MTHTHFYHSNLQSVCCGPSLEAELAPKREVPAGEATALEALLRGDGVLEKKNNLCKEEDTLLEIQVFLPGRAGSFERDGCPGVS